LLIGRKSQLNIGDKPDSVKIRLDPYRVFNKAGIKFKFLSRMYFSLDDSDPIVNTWSIDGDNSLILIQEFKMPIDEKTVIDALKDEYIQMKATVDVKGVQLKGKNDVLDGKRIKMKIGNVSLSQDVYVVKMGMRTTAIILQDTFEDDGNNTSEYAKMVKIFTESFEIQE